MTPKIIEIIVSGIRIRMGLVMFLIIRCPFSRTVCGDVFSIDRLSENQAPQNTPDTSADKNKLINER